jgi:magnesium-transporting ATPase (P-type)
VLALATGPVAGATEADLGSLTFLGFAGLIDPPASGVRETIERLRAADLRTVMLTGDQRLTAKTIGRELGVLHSGDQIIDGRELDGLSREALAHKVRHVAAFSRISPEHKLDVIRALQSAGEIVAMIGDGVNDAPALKKADVGVAMGIRGTDVAKEAAAIVLQDDRFETVAAAVEEGRVIYDNIRKFVFYLFSCNLAEVLMLLAAGVAGLPLPLLPLQILWLNIVTDTFPALALAMEPADAGVMQRTPERSEDAILSRGFVSPILFYGVLIAASALGAFLWALQNAPVRATTIAFMTLALGTDCRRRGPRPRGTRNRTGWPGPDHHRSAGPSSCPRRRRPAPPAEGRIRMGCHSRDSSACRAIGFLRRHGCPNTTQRRHHGGLRPRCSADRRPAAGWMPPGTHASPAFVLKTTAGDAR